jgi:hypothetical protein
VTNLTWVRKSLRSILLVLEPIALSAVYRWADSVSINYAGQVLSARPEYLFHRAVHHRNMTSHQTTITPLFAPWACRISTYSAPDSSCCSVVALSTLPGLPGPGVDCHSLMCGLTRCAAAYACGNVGLGSERTMEVYNLEMLHISSPTAPFNLRAFTPAP